MTLVGAQAFSLGGVGQIRQRAVQSAAPQSAPGHQLIYVGSCRYIFLTRTSFSEHNTEYTKISNKYQQRAKVTH